EDDPIRLGELGNLRDPGKHLGMPGRRGIAGGVQPWNRRCGHQPLLQWREPHLLRRSSLWSPCVRKNLLPPPDIPRCARAESERPPRRRTVTRRKPVDATRTPEVL